MSEEKKVKPGFKTTEFWLTAIAMIVGLVMASGAVPDDSGLSRALGIAAAALAAMGYSVSRGQAKKVLLIFLLPILLLGVAGCCKGHVRAEALEDTLEAVCDRHDKLVDVVDLKTLDLDGDGKLDQDEDRATYKRSTELLRETIRRALK